MKKESKTHQNKVQSEIILDFDQIDCVTNTSKKKNKCVNTTVPSQENSILANVQSSSKLVTNKSILPDCGEIINIDHSCNLQIYEDEDWDKENVDQTSGSQLLKPISLDCDPFEKCSDKVNGDERGEILCKYPIIPSGKK
ncbi:hypothetical protein RF11_08876 [Thelohanellus kitauei]|uniref:Uncharacterized protein n=1 Tax=Thelohanellus kitauei TaxID=669202 RepID=A0A0C2IUY3_THEKT|nr:hypothetical protein RF11_08876 [Thelohanellus kitauei]